jgi:HEPN domain-containing protein
VIGYFLKGVAEDHILVFRSSDPEELLQVIQRLGASRNKQMRALAQQLEINWNESQYKERKKS